MPIDATPGALPISSTLTDALGANLPKLARASISSALGHRVEMAVDDPALHSPGACFVTLTQRGQLRGCVGSLQARRSLLADVQANAVAAALQDTRFAPLSLQELPETDIEVSVLSPMQTLAFESEFDALAQLRPGVDGVVFEFGRYRSTFLPQVWEQLSAVRDFMAQLKRKAGLPADFWDAGVRLQRYTVHPWHDTPGDRSP